MPTPIADTARREFTERYGVAPSIVARAPGRVNLIGEHTDYNDGFVFPMALPFSTALALGPADNGSDIVELTSPGYGTTTFAIGAPTEATPRWARYVHGMAVAVGRHLGRAVPAWRGVLASNIPIGASLSSSAALEMAAGLAMAALCDAEDTISATELARMGQWVENEVIGISSGIMDQLASAASVEGHVSLIDCRSLEVTPTQLPRGVVVVVMDTGTRRELADSEYDDRRRACERAAAALGVAALRDTSLAAVQGLPESLAMERKRATHVVTENERTLQAAEAMKNDDVTQLGALMTESHRSLRDDYEVSGPALDHIVGIAQEAPGCLGARMTGGGFAGCAVALVRAEAADAFQAEVLSRYGALDIAPPQLWICEPGPGAALV